MFDINIKGKKITLAIVVVVEDFSLTDARKKPIEINAIDAKKTNPIKLNQPNTDSDKSTLAI